MLLRNAIDRAGPRHGRAPGKSVIWHHFKPIFFELSRPRIWLAIFCGRVPELWIIFGEILSLGRTWLSYYHIPDYSSVISWRPGQLPGWPIPYTSPDFRGGNRRNRIRNAPNSILYFGFCNLSLYMFIQLLYPNRGVKFGTHLNVGRVMRGFLVVSCCR